MDEKTERACEMTDAAIALLRKEFKLTRGEAARTLLAAMVRWWGIDFEREAEIAVTEREIRERQAER